MNDTNLEQIIRRLERAKRVSGDIIDMPTDHICSKEFCNPENEKDLISRGFLAGPPTSTDIYLCRYRNHHVCTENECRNIDNGVCRISGACYGNPGGYSSYSKTDYRTWHQEFRHNEQLQQLKITANPTIFSVDDNNKPDEPRKRKKRKKKKNPKVIWRRYKLAAQKIVTCLLYSHTRQTINDRAYKQSLKMMEKQIQMYIKSCNQERQVVNIINIMLLQNKYKNIDKKLEILEYQQNVIDKYVDVIMQTYLNVKKYYTESFKFQTIAIGALYEMRQGYELENIILFPSDCFLLYNLPTINDIPAFGFKKANITRGKWIIQIAYNTAVESGVAIGDIL